MSEICKVCGLPKELCACEQIQTEQLAVKINVVKRRYGKKVTVVEFIGESKNVDKNKIKKTLKSKLACGGTMKGDTIELQGDHSDKVKEILVKEFGFTEEQIEA